MSGIKRLAIYYENRLGRNDGNPLYCWADLKKRQEKGLLEIDHLVPNGDYTEQGHYDWNIWVDWGEDGLKDYLRYQIVLPQGKIAYWASDTHLGYDYRRDMCRQATVAFVAQKRAQEEMAKEGIKTIWLPHAVEPQAYPAFNLIEKKYDVCFVGHVNSENRIDALDRLFKEFPNFYYGQALFEVAARKYCESKICFNISMIDDLNMRTFEVMATGSFLLTSWIPTIEDLFEEGVHLVTYKNHDEMVDKARYYLEHDDEREKIAKAGQIEVLANHTITHRVNKILEEINKYDDIHQEELCLTK